MSLPILQEQGGALSGLLRGLGLGVQQAMPTIGEMILNRQKQKQMMEAFPNLFGIPQQAQQPLSYQNLSPQEQEDVGSKFGDLALQLEQQTGQELSPQDLDNVWKQLQMPSSQASQQTGQVAPRYTMEDATKAALMGHHDLAQTILKGVETQEKRGEQAREFHFKRGGKILEEAGASANAMPERKAALTAMRNAVEKDETGFFSPSNISKVLGEITGINLPLDATGAQMSAANKNFLVNTLSKVGAKGLNQYLERQISTAFPQIGQSKEANEQSLLQAELAVDLEQKYLNALQDLYKSQMQTQGHPSADLDLQAQQMIKPDVKQRLKEYEEASKIAYQKGKQRKEEKKVNFSSLDEISTSHQPKKGDEARNKKTGERFVWNGKSWQKLGK